MGRKKCYTRLLKRLIWVRGSVCELCGEAVRAVCLVRKRNRIEVTSTHIRHWTRDGIRVDRVATVEHLKPTAEGGTNELSNVVVACADCNRKRNSETLPKRTHCRFCGRAFEDVGRWRRSRKCLLCHEEHKRIYRRVKGELPDT